MYSRSAASAAGMSLMPSGTGSWGTDRICSVVAGGRVVNRSSCRLHGYGGGAGCCLSGEAGSSAVSAGAGLVALPRAGAGDERNRARVLRDRGGKAPGRCGSSNVRSAPSCSSGSPDTAAQTKSSRLRGVARRSASRESVAFAR
jgi:hypothetical protein